MTAISLFSGMGGDTLGMSLSGISVNYYSEKVKYICQSHDANFKNCKLIGHDICKVIDEEIPTADYVFAGFPCQGFSNAGKKMEDDPRNTLFREFVRVTKIAKPKYIVGENVKGLLSRKTSTGENYIDVIVKEFENLGYTVYHKVLKCEKYGVPQKRERLFIVGSTIKDWEFEFPEEEETIPNLENILKFDMKGALKVDDDLFDILKIPKSCVLTDMKNSEEENNPHPYLKLKLRTAKKEYGEKTFERLVSFGKRESPIHIEILDLRKPAKTIICTYEHQPRMVVPLKNKKGCFIRTLTVDELKQIQGFPADFKIEGSVSQQILQIGNAVPPPVVKRIFDSIKKETIVKVKPVIKWVGGKSDILSTLFEKFPKKINTYWEPFAGGGSVFFKMLELCEQNKMKVGNFEISDKNETLMTLYSSIKDSIEQLISTIEFYQNEYYDSPNIKLTRNEKPKFRKDECVLNAKEYGKEYLYFYYRHLFNTELSGIEKAAMLVFLSKTCFRGLYREGPTGFNTPFGNYFAAKILEKENLQRLHKLFVKYDVKFSCRDFFEIKPKKNDFVYLDPPYYETFDSYQKGGFAHHEKLGELCKDMDSKKIKFVHSNSDCEFNRKLYSQFQISEVVCRQKIDSKNPNKTRTELIICN